MRRYPILTFHSVDESGSVVSTSAAELERLLRSLADAGWRGVTVSTALEAWRRPASPERVVGLSFDDGYRNVREAALPVLADLGFTATVFVIAGRAGRDNRWPGQPPSIPTAPLLDWPELEALVAAGWEVGSHGRDHLPLTALDPDAASRELEDGRRLIEDALGAGVPLVAYPYGAHDATVRAQARRAYQGACAATLALATEADVDDAFALPRIDAYYLRGRSVPALFERPAGRAYLTARGWLRRLRGAPWDRATLAAPTSDRG